MQGTLRPAHGLHRRETRRRSRSSAPASTTWRSTSGWRRTAWTSTRGCSRRWSDPEVYDTNKVRFELMKRLGYFVTESREHNAEYSPWFIPHGQDAIDRYRRADRRIPPPLRRHRRRVRADEARSCRATTSRCEVHRSHEYGSTIIHSMVTGQPSVVYGNMPNRGRDREPAGRRDRRSADAGRPHRAAGSRTVGELPPQLVGYMQPHVDAARAVHPRRDWRAAATTSTRPRCSTRSPPRRCRRTRSSRCATS